MPRPTASERAARMLAIMHVLEPGAELSLDALARTLGASPEEVAEDLVTLSFCGVAPYSPDALVPVYVEDGTVIVFGELPALERAVRLSENQAHAILAALQAAGVPLDDPLCVKLAAVSPKTGLDAARFARLLAGAGSAGADEALKATALAVAEKRVLRLTYQGLRESSPRERVVEPVALLNERGHWYLEAYARDSGALRTFRLDRALSCEVLDEPAPPRELAPAGAVIVTDALPTATVRFAPGEEVSARDWPGVRIVTQDAQGTIAEVPYAGTAWIARQVVSRLGAAELLAPADVRAAVRELALSCRADVAENVDYVE